jgi:uncharacterized RDD family membrane protein YckC
MNYAGWLPRVLAYLVDIIPYGILVGIGGALGRNDDGTLGVLYWVFLLLGFAYLVYNRWIMGGQGQSIGKKVLGLRLIKEETGQPLGPGLAFARDICHFVDAIICGIGYLFPLWDAKKQTIADKIIKSIVVKA